MKTILAPSCSCALASPCARCALVDVDLGFATENRFSFKTNLTEPAYPDAARADRFYEQLSTKLESLPGTLSVGAISYLPLSGEGPWSRPRRAMRPAHVRPRT